VIRLNLVRSGALPYNCPAEAILDSGDFPRAVDTAIKAGRLAELRVRRDRARAEGRLYGIGYAAIVEPLISNIGYITTVLMPEERARAGPRRGAQTTATVAADEINAAAAYGFIFDFCGVEIDGDTGRVRIDKYVTMHDAGRILNPALFDGQVLGGLAHGVGAALCEVFVYSEDGSFLSGTFADYPMPTACEIPQPVTLHRETSSPITPLGAKGVGEGNSISTPVCLANAVADALGIADLALPLTPSRIAELLRARQIDLGRSPPTSGLSLRRAD
jgi:CO/xanthine dehydrogenase Mo-binding subunit